MAHAAAAARPGRRRIGRRSRGRLGAIAAHPDSAAELAIRARRDQSRPGEVAHAVAAGRILETYAFRGATPESRLPMGR